MTSRDGEQPTPEQDRRSRALGLTPAGLYVMTASYDGKSAGVLASWVQRCSSEPPLVSVALFKGHPIEPLIRDSRSFALCQLAETDRLLARRFARDAVDPSAFDTLEVETLATGAPCLKRAVAAIDLEVHRHVDLDADHELFIGLVRDARVFNAGAAPALLYGADASNGFTPF